MFAIRKIKEITSNQLLLELPADFPSKLVEVIILPYSNSAMDNQKTQRTLPELTKISSKNYASDFILQSRR